MKTINLFWLILRLVFIALFILVQTEVIDLQFIVNTLETTRRFASQLLYVFKVLGSYALFSLSMELGAGIVTGFYRRRKKMERHKQDNFIIGITHICNLLLIAGLVGTFLAFFRVGIKEFITSISIVAASLAIIFKDYIANLINGMIVTFSNQLSIDDLVQIGVHRGKITDINLQNVHLMNDDDDVVYIPNQMLFTSVIINYTKGDLKRSSIDFDIDYKFFSTVSNLEMRLTEALKPYADYIKPHSYTLRTFEIQKDKVAFKFQFSLIEYEKELERATRRTVLRAIVDIVEEAEKEMLRKMYKF